MSLNHVFHDPTGRRRRVISVATASIAVLLTLATILFVITIVASPFLPSPLDEREKSSKLNPNPLPERKKQLSTYLLKKAEKDLDREIKETEALVKKQAATKHAPESRIILAFYSTWQDTAIQSLRLNVDKITHLAPEWLHLNASGDGLNYNDWEPSRVPENRDVVAIAREHKIQIHVRLNNIDSGEFEPNRLHLLLSSSDRQKKLAREIKTWLLEQGFQGISIDFDGVIAKDTLRYGNFIQVLHDELKPANLALSVSSPSGFNHLPVRRIGSLCDFVIVFGFDEHPERGEAGSLASLTWFANLLQSVAPKVPPSKVVVALGNHGIDWVENPVEKGALRKRGEPLSYLAALNRGRQFHPNEIPTDVISFDPISRTPYYRYLDEQGLDHVVWFLDATSTYNQWQLVVRGGFRGVGIWNIGAEDPGVWSFISPAAKAAFEPQELPEELSKIKFPYQIDYEGKGEILTARFELTQGQRKVIVDPKDGLVSNTSYETFPASLVIQRSGFREKMIALTFDDGPSEEYTDEILDILDAANVNATFFVIGEQAQKYPNILRRMWKLGNEVGNHTYTHPDMADVSEQRRALELNATQRVLQSILGRSTILFRTPYRGDVEPRTVAEVSAIESASKLNYVTVGMTIDPQDWNDWRVGPDGTRVLMSGEELEDMIVKSVIAEAERGEGNVVLLHDGGGERKMTVKALPKIITALKAQGYQFVRVSELLGMTRENVMPPIQNKDQVLVGVDRLVFETYFGLEYALGAAFSVVLFTGVARLIFVTSLALIGRLREKYDEAGDTRFCPPVSAIVAAYNEKTVISRTIRSLLNSSYPQIEVIVIDDGSKDGTSAEVFEHFGKDPRVVLITQENAGKAAALNSGIEVAKHDILICLDADTQLDAQAIQTMVRHFVDPQVGAVAGNVKVGNRTNILTQWQSIEYISSQNLDRRAYSLLNAITVVPGAAGAWRKSAVIQAGAFLRDTLAEDMDLTWRIRRNNWRVVNEPYALGYTEAPDTVQALFKQRFRWSFGTLQCLWKHRDALFRYGWFGWLGLPTLWIFSIASQVIAPVVDLQLLFAVFQFLLSLGSKSALAQEWEPFAEVVDTLVRVGALYFLLFGLELITSIIAFKMDKEKLKPLSLLFFQRFAYRQLMYAVLWKAVWMASNGLRQGWGKLQRTGNVNLPGSASTGP